MTSPPAVITSRDNPLIKELRKLAQDGAAYRKTGRVWIEGEHLCEAALAQGWQPELMVFLERLRPIAGIESERNAIKSIVISEALMKEVSPLESAPTVGFVIPAPQEQSVQPDLRTVILDRLQDPGNAGSILRSAAAFGYRQVVALKGTVALWSPKVLRAGMGAHFSLRIVEAASIEQLRDLASPLTVTSSHQGQFLHELQATSSLSKDDHSTQNIRRATVDLARFSWVFGHEGQGVSQELQSLAQVHVRIAQPGGEESLNVAAAAAICLHASGVAAMVHQP